MYVIICYDIRDDKRRKEVFKILKNYGVRVQFSVFECNFSKDKYLELKEKLNKKIKEEDDDIKFYLLCESCLDKTDSIGNQNKSMLKSDIIII